MENLEQQILNWQYETFPHATEKAYADKLEEEQKEFLKAWFFESEDRQHEEFVDMVIVAIGLLNKRGVLLSDVIKKKMEINKSRSYGKEDSQGGRKKVA